MLYAVPPDLLQLHQMFDTGARPALVPRSPREEGGIVLVERGVGEQRYDAVKAVLDEEGL